MNARQMLGANLSATDPAVSMMATHADPLRLARIFVPIDFSDESGHAIRYATRMAAQFGASIHLAYVLDSLIDLKAAQLVPLAADLSEATVVLKRKLAALANDQIDESIPVYSHVRVGDPAKEIISLAHAFFTDLIIISTHGRKGFPRTLLGSVTEKVVRHAECPVLVVRAQEHDFA